MGERATEFCFVNSKKIAESATAKNETQDLSGFSSIVCNGEAFSWIGSGLVPQAHVVRKGLPAEMSYVYRGTINHRSLQVP